MASILFICKCLHIATFRFLLILSTRFSLFVHSSDACCSKCIIVVNAFAPNVCDGRKHTWIITIAPFTRSNVVLVFYGWYCTCVHKFHFTFTFFMSKQHGPKKNNNLWLKHKRQHHRTEYCRPHFCNFLSFCCWWYAVSMFTFNVIQQLK